MATARITDQSLNASKDVSIYQSDGSYRFAPLYATDYLTGDMIEGSLFTFNADDASNKIFAQLALVNRLNKKVVVAIESEGRDIDYIDSSKTQLSFKRDGTFTIYNPDFEKLAEGEIADVSIRFLMFAEKLNGSIFVVNTTTLQVSGSNEAPVVAAPLSSVTDEDQPVYSIDLLQGASDIDHGAVLNVVNVVEISGMGGWNVQGNTIVVDPSVYGYLNDGENKTLNFTYQVMDEYGATANQSLRIDVEGITDAPTLEVTTRVGSDVHEVMLHVTSTQAANEQVRLAFLEKVLGAVEEGPVNSGSVAISENWVPGVDFKVYDESGRDVTNGIENFFADGYAGSHDFKVVFNDADADLSSLVKVEVTGIHPAHGDYPYKELTNSQSIELNYDVNETLGQGIAFENSDQNMWGDFGSPVIEWHEYLPVLGTDFMQWKANEVGEYVWVNTAVAGNQYWNSGTITLADVSFDSSDISDEALSVLKGMKDGALATLTVAQNVYNQVKGIPQVLADFDAAEVIEDAFDTAKATLKSLEDTLATEKSTLRKAVGDAAFNVAHVFDIWYLYDDHDWYNPFDDEWRQYNTLGDAARATALLAWDTAASIYDAIDAVVGFDSLKQAVYDAIDAVSDFTTNTYNGAKAVVDGLVKTSVELFNDFTALVNKIPDTLGLNVPDLPDADDWAAFLNTLASKLDATVEGGFAFLAKVAQDAYDVAASAINSVGFSTELKVDADISGYAGVLIDFRLDGGSVDTDVPYVFSSKTQYNQTTDMLAITPILVNLTDGTEAEFSTASPNVSITAKLLYDVAAALDVYLNGSMVLAGKDFSLGDGINFSPIFSTSGSNMQFSVIDESKPFLDESGLHLDNLNVTLLDHIVPYSEMFGGNASVQDYTPGEVTLFDFDSSTGDFSVPFYSDNLYELASGKLTEIVSGLTEGMIEEIEVALPYIATQGEYVSQADLLSEYTSSPEYLFKTVLDPDYSAADQSFGQNINDYYYDETLKTFNPDQILSIFENASISVGKEIEALLDLEYLQAQGYTNLEAYLEGADIGAIIKDISLNFAKNAFDLFKETLDGKYTTDAFVIVDMTGGESDALFHINTFNFNTDNILTDPLNPDSWSNPLLPYQDPDITDDTAAFGLYVASGESDPMYKITLDVDEMVAFVLRKVVLAVTGVDLPDFVSPFKMGASLDDILNIAEVDVDIRTEIKKYIDVGMTVERMDYNVTSFIDFSQDFTLTVDDMTYMLTFTETDDSETEAFDPVTMEFKASEADKIIIANASQYDVNGDGNIAYDLQIVPTAMFSNDTELGYNYGLSLDFLTTALKATIGLPLKDLTGIALLPNLSYDLLDYNIGPVLVIDAEINGLDIDVWESRYDMDIGSITLEDNSVNINLLGVQLEEAVPLVA